MTLLDQDVLGVTDAEAPRLRLAVVLPDSVEEDDNVVLGLSEPVPLPLPVEVGESVDVGVAGGVALLEREVLPV